MAAASTSTGISSKEKFLNDDYVPQSAVPRSTGGLRGLAESSTGAVSSFLAPVLSPLQRASAKLDSYREHLELPYPGQVDTLGKECKSEHFSVLRPGSWLFSVQCKASTKFTIGTIREHTK